MFAVLFIDFDEFKLVNDSWGHDVGDELLKCRPPGACRCALRPGDTLARLGGDEFVVVAEGLSSASDAVEIATRIQKSLQQEFLLGEQQISLTASIGIAVNDDDDE